MMDGEFQDYQGVRLVAPETRVLEELEEQLGHPIPPVAEFTEQLTRFGFITEVNHVTELALDAQQLSNLPASLGTLCHLRLLSLAFNQLRSLPESIGQLQSLQELNLWGNQLQVLPETIGQLQNLRELFFAGNQLQSLPKSIGQLQSLQYLNLKKNQLQSLPKSIGQLQSLQELHLSNNQLKLLPKSVGQLESLRTLKIDRNQLQSVPESIGQLQSLKYIEYRKNPLHYSLTSIITLIGLAQRNKMFKPWIPEELFTHPLIQPLVRESLTCLSNSICPFCGTTGLIAGLEKNTTKKRFFGRKSAKKRILCLKCNNRLQ